MCKRCGSQKCHDDNRCCKKVYCKVKKIEETTTDTNQTVHVIDETTKNTNECCAQVLEIVKNIQNEIAPIIDPETGCQVSSQAIIDTRNLYADTILQIAPQLGILSILREDQLVPSDGDFSVYFKWQRWDDVSVAEQVNLLENVRETLFALDIEGLTEQERRCLLTLPYANTWYSANPRTSAVGNGNGSAIIRPINDTMVGLFLGLNGLFGLNFFSAFFGNEAALESWNNYIVSLTEYKDYLSRRADEDLVWSQLDLDGSLGLYPAIFGIRATALAPFAGDPLLPDAEAAYDTIELLYQELIDFLSPGGNYYTKSSTIRSTASPGLGAPGLNSEARTIDYPFDLEINATTKLTAEEIHTLGLQQVSEIQDATVELVNTKITPGDPVADWTELNDRYNNDPAYRANFLEEVTVGERISQTERDVYEAYTKCILAFQNFPSAPLQVDPFIGFGARSYNSASIAPGGTKSVILSNGVFNQNTLSDTDPIDFSEIITQSKGTDSSITYHESFPGHHFNFGIQVETACNVASAFNGGAIEGWGLYAEQVAANDMFLALINPEAEEAGVPEKPFRRLSFFISRLLRAVRLVVDTGLHNLGWSRQEVVDYMTLNLINQSPESIQSEVDRYTVWPGQAVGYLVGALVLDRERTRAETALGEDFNLPEYHDVLLRYITPVEDSIIYLTDFYINSKQAGTFGDLWPSITPQPLRAPLTASETANPTQGLSLSKISSRSITSGSKSVKKKFVVPNEFKKIVKEKFTMDVPI